MVSIDHHRVSLWVLAMIGEADPDPKDPPMTPKIASATSVDLPALLDFVRPRHQMILITQRADPVRQAEVRHHF